MEQNYTVGDMANSPAEGYPRLWVKLPGGCVAVLIFTSGNHVYCRSVESDDGLGKPVALNVYRVDYSQWGAHLWLSSDGWNLRSLERAPTMYKDGKSAFDSHRDGSPAAQDKLGEILTDAISAACQEFPDILDRADKNRHTEDFSRLFHEILDSAQKLRARLDDAAAVEAAAGEAAGGLASMVGRILGTCSVDADLGWASEALVGLLIPRRIGAGIATDAAARKVWEALCNAGWSPGARECARVECLGDLVRFARVWAQTVDPGKLETLGTVFENELRYIKAKGNVRSYRGRQLVKVCEQVLSGAANAQVLERELRNWEEFVE